MIEFCYETDFRLTSEQDIIKWLHAVAESENGSIQELVYVFCDDERLHQLNKKFLDHDTYTDILTFPYEEGETIRADIFISIPRVRENAKMYQVDFVEELRRVMIHGVLHLLGYDDHTKDDKQIMRELEQHKMKMFHVEQ